MSRFLDSKAFDVGVTIFTFYCSAFNYFTIDVDVFYNDYIYNDKNNNCTSK